MKSHNGYLILEPYTGSKGLKSTGEKTGFASVQQKTGLVCLKLLVDSSSDTLNLKKGDRVYFKEEDLYNAAWASKTYESNALGARFILAHKDYVVLTSGNK